MAPEIASNPDSDAGLASGIIGVPIGTLTEIQEAGLNPALVACCAPGDGTGAVRGCPVWASCQFHRRDMGGFKGKGPRYIGFFLKTARADRARVMEGVMSCYNFVRTLQGRMQFGRAQRDAGKDHELIRVIEQEGGQVLVQRWERNAADGGNRSGDITMRGWAEPMTVPAFPRPNQNPMLTYEQQLRDREDRRASAEDDEERVRFERMRLATAAVADPDDGGDPESGDDAAVVAEPEAPLAAPIVRPRKPGKR